MSSAAAAGKSAYLDRLSDQSKAGTVADSPHKAHVTTWSGAKGDLGTTTASVNFVKHDHQPSTTTTSSAGGHMKSHPGLLQWDASPNSPEPVAAPHKVQQDSWPATLQDALPSHRFARSRNFERSGLVARTKVVDNADIAEPGLTEKLAVN